jgi:hypothetical protein
MASGVDKNFIASLAAANGLRLPESRLDRVLKQYQSFLRQIERFDAFELKREAEPSVTFSLEREADKGAIAPRPAKADGGTNAKK